jgi:hypothetical protein
MVAVMHGVPVEVMDQALPSTLARIQGPTGAHQQLVLMAYLYCSMAHASMYILQPANQPSTNTATDALLHLPRALPAHLGLGWRPCCGFVSEMARLPDPGGGVGPSQAC